MLLNERFIYSHYAVIQIRLYFRSYVEMLITLTLFSLQSVEKKTLLN